MLLQSKYPIIKKAWKIGKCKLIIGGFVIIIIDGYNLLRHIFPKVKGFLDKQRKQIIEQLSYYKSKKLNNIQEIIIVFDGGEFGHASREVRSGIVVVFAGQKSSADDWILGYVSRHKNQETLLVSLDRKLTEDCEKFNTQSIDVFEFYNILKNCLLEEVSDQLGQNNVLQKYDDAQVLEDFPTTIDHEALALLMKQASFYENPTKDDDHGKQAVDTKRLKGNSLKLSKKEKMVYSKLKKLR